MWNQTRKRENSLRPEQNSYHEAFLICTYTLLYQIWAWNIKQNTAKKKYDYELITFLCFLPNRKVFNIFFFTHFYPPENFHKSINDFFTVMQKFLHVISSYKKFQTHEFLGVKLQISIIS